VKRALSLLLVGFIICLIILNPVLVGNQSNVRALTFYETQLTMMGPAFMSWFNAQVASMGMQTTQLRDQLTYLNRNGEIDEFFQALKDRYVAEVTVTEGIRGTYYKTPAPLWKDMFNGVSGLITGVKEMYNGSTNPASPWYVEPAETINNYNNQRIYNPYSSTVSWSGLNDAQKDSVSADYETHSLIVGTNRYMVEKTATQIKWYILDVNNQRSDMYSFNYGSSTFNGYGYIPILRQHNAEGTYVNGSKWYLQVSMYAIYNNPGKYYYSPDTSTYDSAVTDSEYSTMQTIPVVEFADLSAYTLTDEQVQSDDYVGVLVPTEYVVSMETAIGEIGDGHVTLEEAVITIPQITDLDIETSNPVIQSITGAVAVAEVAVPDFPQVERFKMPTGITTKFPFSIPWDLRNAVFMMQADAVIPIFTIPFVIESINFSDEIVIDLTQFELLAKITRWFILAIFLIGLILVTRQLIKG